MKTLILVLLFASAASAQSVSVDSVHDGLSYVTAGINPALATWKALHSADVPCALTRLAVSELIGNGVTFVLKRTIRSARPDGSGFDGMPSGHAMNGAIGAFANGGWGFAFTVPTPWLRVEADKHTKKQAALGALLGLGSDAAGRYIVKCDP